MKEKNIDLSGQTIVVGMSGGVDSSVCAAILKEQGHNVIGLFMKNWDETDENGVCQASKDYADVEKVCDRLEIPCYSIEFIKEYHELVFKQFIAEYKMGYTPNPDILCNREIKFNVFYKKALELGADFVATGHYCQNIVIGGVHQLVKGLDKNKDQSYFLYTIKSNILERVLFPIGHLEKTEVREIAAKWELATKDKKDSTGICFIGERNFKKFLGQYITFQSGEFRTLDEIVVGEHTGAAYYTIGQRKGLGLGGPGNPWYVVNKDIQKNIVYVERGDQHPALYRDDLICNEVSWVDESFSFQVPYKCFCKIRYRQADQACTIESYNKNTGELKVSFETAQKAMTIRQSIVFYQTINAQMVCLGGGMIKDYGKSYHEMNKAVPSI